MTRVLRQKDNPLLACVFIGWFKGAGTSRLIVEMKDERPGHLEMTRVTAARWAVLGWFTVHQVVTATSREGFTDWCEAT